MLGGRHSGALDRAMAKILRRIARGMMRLTHEDGSTRCHSNNEVFKWWRMPRCATALCIRRLRWYLTWARHPEDFGSVLAAVSGTPELDRLCGIKRLENGSAHAASTPWAQQVIKHCQALAEITEGVANWHPQGHSDISMFQTGTRAMCDYEEPDLRGWSGSGAAKGHLLGPPGIRAGMAPMEGISETVAESQKEDAASVGASLIRAIDTLNNILALMDGSNTHGHAMVNDSIKLRKVSEGCKARSSKNNEQNEDEYFWEEDMSNNHISIDATTDFRAAPPKGTREEGLEKHDKFSGHNLKNAVRMLIVFAGGKKSQSAAPKTELERRPVCFCDRRAGRPRQSAIVGRRDFRYAVERIGVFGEPNFQSLIDVFLQTSAGRHGLVSFGRRAGGLRSPGARLRRGRAGRRGLCALVDAPAEGPTA
ncbi:unnamed protein product, partial [Prorocentrum cordatum]